MHDTSLHGKEILQGPCTIATRAFVVFYCCPVKVSSGKSSKRAFLFTVVSPKHKNPCKSIILYALQRVVQFLPDTNSSFLHRAIYKSEGKPVEFAKPHKKIPHIFLYWCPVKIPLLTNTTLRQYKKTVPLLSSSGGTVPMFNLKFFRKSMKSLAVFIVSC